MSTIQLSDRYSLINTNLSSLSSDPFSSDHLMSGINLHVETIKIRHVSRVQHKAFCRYSSFLPMLKCFLSSAYKVPCNRHFVRFSSRLYHIRAEIKKTISVDIIYWVHLEGNCGVFLLMLTRQLIRNGCGNYNGFIRVVSALGLP